MEYFVENIQKFFATLKEFVQNILAAVKSLVGGIHGEEVEGEGE